jgi:hypothetical protein
VSDDGSNQGPQNTVITVEDVLTDVL